MNIKPLLSFSRLKNLFFTLFVLVLLSVFAVGNVQAKKKGKPSPPPPPDSMSESLVRWGGDEPTPGVLEANYRLCSVTEAAADMSSGTFSCNMNGSKVFYDFANFITEVAHNRGEDSRCSSAGSQYYIEPDLEYSFSWNGDCSSVSGCEVKVVNRFSNVAVLGGPVTRVRLDPSLASLVFEGFGRISNSTVNPFESAQSLTIDYMHITFIGTKGKNKALAECRALPKHENYPVRFETLVADP